MESLRQLHRQDFPFRTRSDIAHNRTTIVGTVEGTEDPFSGKLFACKEFLRGYPDSKIEAIMKRVEAFRSVRHGHLVHIIGTYLFKEENCLAILMEPIADGNLKWYLYHQEENLQVRNEVSRWFNCLVNALAFLHGAGITHGAVDSTHILVNNQSVLLTCSTHSAPVFPVREYATVVRECHRRNSLLYHPPEGQLVDKRSDIFALGVVFIEMLVIGTQPQRCEEFKETFFRSYTEVYDPDEEDQFGMSVTATEWMKFFGRCPATLPWQSKIADLSADMLKNDYRERPHASDILLWWSRQSAASLPSTPCRCGQGESVQRPKGLEKTEERIAMAPTEGDSLPATSLGEKSGKPGKKLKAWKDNAVGLIKRALQIFCRFKRKSSLSAAKK